MKDYRVVWFAGVAWFLATPILSAEPSAAAPAADQTEAARKWLGRAVMTKSPDVVLRQAPHADAPVAAVSPQGIWLQVERVEGDWLVDAYGCVKAADVVLNDEVIDFFTRRLETAESAFAYLCRSRGWIVKQEFDKALADASEAARLEPNNARVFFAQARIAQAQKRHGDELSAYDRAFALDPRDVAVLKARGELLSAARPDPDKAISDFDAAIAILPSDSELWALRGSTWLRKGDHDKALNDFDEAIRLNRNNASAFAGRAWLHYQRQQYDAALADSSRAIVLDPKRAYAFSLRGTTRLAQRQFEGALGDLDEAIRLGLSNAATFANRAIAHLYMRQYDAAMADLTQAISLKSDDPRLYQFRAQIWMMKRDAASALIDLAEYVRLRPDDADALVERAFLYADREEFEKALNDFAESIRLDSGNATAYAGRAACRVRLGQLDLALDDAAMSVRLEPDAAEGWEARAYVREARREYREATDDLARALELADKTSRGSVENGLAWLLATCPDETIRDGKRSLELARAAIAKLPHDAEVCDTLAAAFAETGDFTRAVYWQTKAIEQSEHESGRAELQKRLVLYQNKQPYREDDATAGRPGPRGRSPFR